MKKNSLKRFVMSTIFFVSIFGSCEKENGLPDQSNASATASGSSDAITTVYSLCNRALNVFDPPANIYYSFALKDATNYMYGISDNDGVIDFQNIDKFSFEFSGLYVINPNTPKLYYIRRTDGKYLSWKPGFISWGVKTGYAQWAKKMIGSQEQLWIISKIGDNKYNLLLSRMCDLMTIEYDSHYYSYRAIFVISDQTTYSGTIHMLPHTISKPPSTQ